MRLVAFCEAAADFRIASELLDRILREAGPDWVSDVLEANPEGVRTWRGDGEGQAFFDLHDLTTHVKQLGIRVPHGHFDGRPGITDAVMGRTAFAIVRALARHGEPVDAVVMIRDMDDQPERAKGLHQARIEAQSLAVFRIVLGCAHPMREAWVLCGFEPDDDDEHARLHALRQELGFAPNEQAHQLDATNDQAKRSAKRILGVLTNGDREREQRCWQATSLHTLRDRGEQTGLRAYLIELKDHVVSLVARKRRA
ncbi:MAG TPA: hypothetical protein VH165_04600 [Kofleriaceae bacterium]|jgi:hypothetical protein|nr:hypothetical protein [Kofleriaceae bacterium]